MDETYEELHALYSELYNAVPPAHTVPAVAPYWSHIARQLMALNRYADLSSSGQFDGATEALAEVKAAHSEGLGGQEQWALMEANAAGEIERAVGDPERAKAIFASLSDRLSGAAELDSPGI